MFIPCTIWHLTCKTFVFLAMSVSDLRTYQVLPGRNIPKWRAFLAVDENKAALSDFLSEYVSSAVPQLLSPGQTLFMVGGQRDGLLVDCVRPSGVDEVPSMTSDHEEADTRLVLHCQFFNDSLKGKYSFTLSMYIGHISRYEGCIYCLGKRK